MKMKNTTQKPLKQKWTGPIDMRERNSLKLKHDNNSNWEREKIGGFSWPIYLGIKNKFSYFQTKHNYAVVLKRTASIIKDQQQHQGLFVCSHQQIFIVLN